VEWLRSLRESLKDADVLEEKADLLHAIDRGPRCRIGEGCRLAVGGAIGSDTATGMTRLRTVSPAC